MKIKLCPLCDCEMTRNHYCSQCHSFIWKPEILDVHFNTTTRGLGEEDCAYGDAHDAFDHQSYGKYGDSDFDHRFDTRKKDRSKNRTGSRAQTVTRTRTSAESEYKSTSRRDENRQSGKKPGGVIRKVIFAVVAMEIIGALAGTFFEAIGDGALDEIIQEIEQEFNVDLSGIIKRNDGVSVTVKDVESLEDILGGTPAQTEPYFDDYMSEEDYEAIDEGDLALYPDGCNAQAHFLTQGVTVENAIDECMMSLSDSYRASGFKDLFKAGELVNLNQTVEYEIDENWENGYVDVASDAVTGNLHYVYGDYLAEDAGWELIEATLLALGEETKMDEAKTEEMLQTMMTDYENEDFIYWTINNGMISVYPNDDGTMWFMIQPDAQTY